MLPWAEAGFGKTPLYLYGGSSIGWGEFNKGQPVRGLAEAMNTARYVIYRTLHSSVQNCKTAQHQDFGAAFAVSLGQRVGHRQQYVATTFGSPTDRRKK